MLQVFSIVRETTVSRTLIYHVSRKTHVSESNIRALKVGLKHRLDPRIVLHAISQTVAINGDDIVLL